MMLTTAMSSMMTPTEYKLREMIYSNCCFDTISLHRPLVRVIFIEIGSFHDRFCTVRGCFRRSVYLLLLELLALPVPCHIVLRYIMFGLLPDRNE